MRAIVQAFEALALEIGSELHKKESNAVLAAPEPGLTKLGFIVESGKQLEQKISVPVLFGMNGKVEKDFEADAYHHDAQFVVEVEAGRGYTSNQFLRDLFQACMMHEFEYFGVAVRLDCRGNKDFKKVKIFFDILCASGRLKLPFKGLLLVG